MAERDNVRGVRERVWGLIVGRRTAAVLLAVFTALAAIGVAYPQDRLMSAGDSAAFAHRFPTLAAIGRLAGLGRLFTTWYFFAVVGLLAVSVVACTAERVMRHLRRELRVPRALSSGARREVSGAPSGSELVEAMGGLPGSARFIEDEGRVYAESGRLGFWGSVVFHAALVIVAAGAVLSALTQFRGVMLVTEGQTVTDTRAAYLRVDREPVLGQAYSGREVTLEKLAFAYAGDTLTRASGRFAVEGSREMSAEVNYPLDVGEKSFLLGDSGYAVRLRVTTPSGAVVDRVVNLGVRRPAGYSDSVELPGGTLLDVFVVPDGTADPKEEQRRRYDLRHPRAYVKVATGGTSQSGSVAAGDGIELEGYTVRIEDVRLWNEMLVRADRGRLVVYVGFWMAVLGLAVRLADPDRRALIADASVYAVHRFGPGASQALADRIAGSRRTSVPRKKVETA